MSTSTWINPKREDRFRKEMLKEGMQRRGREKTCTIVRGPGHVVVGFLIEKG